MLNIWHPGRYLPRSNKTFLDVDGQEKRSDRGGWDDKRPFILTLLDPFDIGGLIQSRIQKSKEKKAAAAAAGAGNDENGKVGDNKV